MHFVSTGAGLGAIEELWQTPGASSVLLGGQIPYTYEMTDRLLGYKPSGSYACEENAAALANVGFFKAQELLSMGKKLKQPLLSVACSAAVQTVDPRRGADRAHLAFRTDGGLYVATVIMPKTWSRSEQGKFCDELTLQMMLWGAGKHPGEHLIVSDELIELNRAETLRPRRLELQQLEGEALYFDRSGAPATFDPEHSILFAGSFNPLSWGHIRMARYGEQASGKTAVFELVSKHCFKGVISHADLMQRANQMRGIGPVLVGTDAALFIDKVRRYGARTFLIGADIAQKIAKDSTNALMGEFLDRGVEFFVMRRAESDGQILRPRDYAGRWVDLFTDLPASFDISSTELRAAASAAAVTTAS